MPQGAREGGAAYIEDVRTDICSSATARLGLLSRSTAYIHVSVLHYSTSCMTTREKVRLKVEKLAWAMVEMQKDCKEQSLPM